jgi:dTDP-glucose 4,6-dehydratase
MTHANLLAPDLEALLERSAGDLEHFKGSRLFVSGGTGFVGSWLLEAFAWANRRLALGASAVVLSRDPASFAAAAPHLAHDPAISLSRGDVRDPIEVAGSFDAIIHAATAGPAEGGPEATLGTIVDGTRRVLELARRNGAIPLLFTSSGAVYGRQPQNLERLAETYLGGPDQLQPRYAYNEAKRLAEMLCAIALHDGGPNVKIARLFAFVGPYLPLDRNFAIGNFIADALAGRTIEVKGDGTATRTYLYGADLASWLWRILARGTPGRPYNVGGERALTIAEIAATVRDVANPGGAVTVAASPGAATPDSYVPDVRRARDELGLVETFTLERGIARTLEWHRARAMQL